MAWKEKLKDLGKDVAAEALGYGPERQYEKDVAEYIKNHRVSPEQAEKAIFFERMGNVKDAIGLEGLVPGKSKDWRGFEAALNVLFTKDQQADFLEKSKDPAIYHGPPVHPPDLRWQGRVADHFKKTFGGRSPEAGVVRGYTADNSLLWSLLHRADADPRLHAGRLHDAVSRNPDLAADIGKMFAAHNSISRHENKFGQRLALERSQEKLKNVGREAISKMAFEEPAKWLRVVAKNTTRPSFEGFFKMAGATAKLFVKEGWYAGKFLAQALGTGYRYGRERFT